MNILTHIAIIFLKLISYLPLWFLFLISDIMAPLIYLFGYRKKVVYNNLHIAFPEKSEEEISIIAKKFYRHLADLFVETIKLHAFTQKQILRRVKVFNSELLNKYCSEGKDVIVVMGHYGNWEWGQVINIFSNSLGTEVYHPLKNKIYDSYMLKLRSKWGTLNFTMKNCYREMLRLKQKDIRFMIGMIADQSPSRPRIQYYTEFFGKQVPVLTGVEKMAEKTNSPVVFLRMDKIKRGYYNITIEPITDNPKGLKPYELTDMHTKHLEQIIKEKPEFWLWSHKRWKYMKEDD